MKYNNTAKGGGSVSAAFCDFVRTLQPSDEVLLVSGSNRKPNSLLDSAVVLQNLCTATPAKPMPAVAVAFNPFFPTRTEQETERQRLLKKLQCSGVTKVYFQFGSDLDLLRSSLEWLASVQLKRGVRKLQLAGSIFLPTRKLIAQQKFRGWNGVYLTAGGFLDSPEEARKVVLDMLILYSQFGIEVLVEAPGVRNEKDMDVLEALLRDHRAATTTMSSPRTTPPLPPGTDVATAVAIAPKRRKVVLSQHVGGGSRKAPQSVPRTALQKPAIVVFGSFDVRLNDNRALELACLHTAIIPGHSSLPLHNSVAAVLPFLPSFLPSFPLFLTFHTPLPSSWSQLPPPLLQCLLPSIIIPPPPSFPPHPTSLLTSQDFLPVIIHQHITCHHNSQRYHHDAFHHYQFLSGAALSRAGGVYVGQWRYQLLTTTITTTTTILTPTFLPSFFLLSSLSSTSSSI
jgi:hypothetical protein